MEALDQVVTIPLMKWLSCIHWAVDDIKELANKQAEKEDKFAMALDAFGEQLAVMVQKVQDLNRAMPPKPANQ